MIQEFAVLAFDPKKENYEIKMVFSDDLARALWLAIRPSHMTDQHFENGCLKCAEIIRRVMKSQIGSLTPDQLLSILSLGERECKLIGTGELDFAAELLPIVTGEKKIEFEVRESEPLIRGEP